MKLVVKINKCPKCKGSEISKLEYGDYWCKDCNTMFTKQDFKKKEKVEV